MAGPVASTFLASSASVQVYCPVTEPTVQTVPDLSSFCKHLHDKRTNRPMQIRPGPPCLWLVLVSRLAHCASAFHRRLRRRPATAVLGVIRCLAPRVSSSFSSHSPPRRSRVLAPPLRTRTLPGLGSPATVSTRHDCAVRRSAGGCRKTSPWTWASRVLAVGAKDVMFWRKITWRYESLRTTALWARCHAFPERLHTIRTHHWTPVERRQAFCKPII